MALSELQAELIQICLVDFKKDLLKEIFLYGSVKAFVKDEFVIRQDEIVRFLPIVLEGHIKVIRDEDGMNFLLYYIFPKGTCIFSFANLFIERSAFSAISETQSTILLVPFLKAAEWQEKYPEFNNMILRDFQRHYQDLLETTRQLICYNLEDRVLSYLKNKSMISNSHLLAISHQKIASDFATSREVVSRVWKKMEKDGKLIQEGRKIKLTAYS